MPIQHFFDPDTFTLTYVVYDSNSNDAIVIDPVLDFDPPSGKVEDKSIQMVIKFIQEKKLNLHFILETHAHADHLSSSQILKQLFPKAQLAISERIKDVQKVFKEVFNLSDFKPDGSQFDFLLKDHETISAGSLVIKIIPTPGHTPACTSFLIGESLFVGDALFMPDYGCGRCDFPGGSAKNLFESIQKLYTLPDSTQVYVGHDYGPNGRELKFETTIGESKKNNIQIKTSTIQEEFISFREARDKTLSAPRLLLPSLQINIAGGRLPQTESNGKSYLKLPLNPFFKLIKF